METCCGEQQDTKKNEETIHVEKVLDDDSTPVKGEQTPSKEEPTPSKENPTPGKDDQTPSKGGPTPSKENPMPGKEEQTPSKREESPPAKDELALAVIITQDPVEKAVTAGTAFAITLTKADGEALGLDVDWGGENKLLIKKIKDGLIKKWNSDAKNSDKQVNVGDSIVAVNRLRGDGKELKKMIEEAQTLKEINLVILMP